MKIFLLKYFLIGIEKLGSTVVCSCTLISLLYRVYKHILIHAHHYSHASNWIVCDKFCYTLHKEGNHRNRH